MSAVEALNAAQAAGVMVSIDGDDLVLQAFMRPQSAADLLDRLRTHKAEIIELLSGSRCRHCVARITSADWQHPGGCRALAFADGSSAHVMCHEATEADRLLRAAQRGVAPDLVHDEAEVTLRGEVE